MSNVYCRVLAWLAGCSAGLLVLLLALGLLMLHLDEASEREMSPVDYAGSR